jgi:hypothetical protein
MVVVKNDTSVRPANRIAALGICLQGEILVAVGQSSGKSRRRRNG